ncbi:hypothetical protein BABINDRAFT_19882, partial [Babjeviella inositovora NRRL Y-12698]
KNLILCFDGTSQQFGPKPFTNVLKLFRMLAKDSYDKQMCYYQPGIGTSFQAEATSLKHSDILGCALGRVDADIDTMIAFSLDAHAKAAYKYLMKFYAKGDRIYLFGFSRGAFTARVLAGMIERVGLLNSGLEDMVDTAWSIYKTWEYAGQPAQQGDLTITLVEEFKSAFTRGIVKIHFMGLWDSVNSVGLLRDRLFPFTARSNIVKHVRHAVSLDERRGKYKQNLFLPIDVPPSPDLVEMWFPGEHSDVGGGWSPTPDGQFLSNLPLRWMLFHAVKYGVLFKEGSIHEFAVRYPSKDSLYAGHHDALSLRIRTKGKYTQGTSDANWVSRSLSRIINGAPSENKTTHFITNKKKRSSLETFVIPRSSSHESSIGENVLRFASRAEESFTQALLWWLIELVPVGTFIENENGEWKSRMVPNLGRHRRVPDNPLIHWSVFYRKHLIEDYNPKNL